MATIPISMEHSGIPIVFLADHPNLAFLSVPSYHLGIGKPRHVLEEHHDPFSVEKSESLAFDIRFSLAVF